MTKVTNTKPIRRSRASPKTQGRLPRGLTERIVWHSVGDLKPFPGNPRQHPESQIAGLMKSIRKVWTIPILIDETGTILAGHGRLEAAKRLGMNEVPTVTIAGLSPGEKRAVLIADNRLPEKAVWDFDILRGHFKDLIDIDFDVELTGFTTGGDRSCFGWPAGEARSGRRSIRSPAGRTGGQQNGRPLGARPPPFDVRRCPSR